MFQSSFSPSFSTQAFSSSSFSRGQQEMSARSGFWRLNLYRLQEKSESERKERLQVEISKTSSQILPHDTQNPPVKSLKPQTPNHPRLDRITPDTPRTLRKPLNIFTPPPLEFEMLQRVWSLLSRSSSDLLQAQLKTIQLMNQVQALEDDEETILLLI